MIPFNHLGWAFKYMGSAIYPKSVREALCTFLEPVSKDASVLDLGAGTGILCEFAYRCRDDLKFTAVDPAEGMLKFAPKYVETHKASAEALPFGEACFEAVFMGEALHHFQDIDASLREIVRVLQQEGRLFIYDFDVSTFMGKSICTVEKLFGEPGKFFTPEVLKRVLESHGFSVTISQYGWRYTVDASLY